MKWAQVTRADPRANLIAKRHYNCQSPLSDQFVPPGRYLALHSTRRGQALWVTSFPYAEYVKHAWAGAWVNSLFRNESRVLASVLIRQAVAASRWHFGEPPALGMVSFVDPRYVLAKPILGRCYLEAGFRLLPERTKQDDLLVFQMLPSDMPEAEPPVGSQLRLVA